MQQTQMQAKQNPVKKFLSTQGVGQVLSALAGLIILLIAFSCINPKFMTGANIMNLLRQICPFLLVGIGQAYVCITGNIDLSIGSVMGMSCMISATLMTKGVNPWAAVLIAMVCCLAVGFINGVLVGRFKLPPFIATLGTMTVARGVAQIVNGNYNTDSIGEAAQTFKQVFYYGKTLGVFNGVWICVIIWLIFNFYLGHTKSGRHIYAIGSNVDAARLSGINVLSTTTKAYVVSAFCAGVAGLIACAQAGMGSMETGTCYEMYAVAAAVIGGVSTLGGTGLLGGVIVGASIWAVLQNGLTFAGVPIAIRNIIIGIIVVACVLIDVLLRGGKRIRKPKNDKADGSAPPAPAQTAPPAKETVTK